MNRNEYVSFSDLYTADFEVTDIFAMRQKWFRGVTFHMDHPRKSSAVIYLNGCVGEYASDSSDTFVAPCKSLVCLPAYSEYRVLNVDCGLAHPDAYLVEFNIVKDHSILTFAPTPFVIEGLNAPLASELMREVVETYEASIRSPMALKAAIYRLITFLGRESRRSYEKKYLPIAKGIELLESDTLCERSVAEIAGICGVSSGCFRRLFREYSGKSPAEYRNDVRLDRAKNMLLGNNMTVDTIADALGFESGAYFCRFFKKKIGMTPKEYRKKHI